MWSARSFIHEHRIRRNRDLVLGEWRGQGFYKITLIACDSLCFCRSSTEKSASVCHLHPRPLYLDLELVESPLRRIEALRIGNVREKIISRLLFEGSLNPSIQIIAVEQRLTAGLLREIDEPVLVLLEFLGAKSFLLRPVTVDDL